MAAILPQSRRPLVWFSRCRMVMGAPYSGSSGMYFRTGSSIASFPCCARRRTAAAVNCLVTEPGSNTVSGVFGTSCSRSAIPYAAARTVSPFKDTPTAQPGVAVLLYRAKMRSTAGFWAAGCPKARATPASTIATRFRIFEGYFRPIPLYGRLDLVGGRFLAGDHKDLFADDDAVNHFV